MTSLSIDRFSTLREGVAVKAPCRVATTANITLAGIQTIDSVLLVADNRVLVKNQTDTTENGVYTVSSGIWRRAADFDGRGELVQGTFIAINSGSTNASTIWRVSTASPSIGSALAFTKVFIDATGYAELAQAWASQPENEDVEGAETGDRSALHWAAKTAVDAIATATDAVATGEDRVQTGLDRVATAADRVQTGLDRVATGEDREATAADVEAAQSAAQNAVENLNALAAVGIIPVVDGYLPDAFDESSATVYNPASDDPAFVNSVTTVLEEYETDLDVAAPSYARTLSQLIGETNIPISLFGVTKGLASGDQSAAMNNLIDHLSDQYLSTTYNSGLSQVEYSVDLGAGIIRLEEPLDPLPFGVRFYGRGAAHTKFACYGAFDAISTQEFETDGVTRRYHNNMRFEDFGILSMLTAGDRTTGMRLKNMIRNCGVARVGHQGCVRGFDIDWTWTLVLKDCFGQGGLAGQPIEALTENHIYLNQNCGAITIDGGRYDIAEGPHLYVDGTDVVELIVKGDAAFQFGKKGGIKVVGARTVRIESAFLEGNCIGNPAEYYLDLQGSNTSLSSCRVEGVVTNNLADSNRNGLGAAFIDKFREVEYEARWARNDLSKPPIFGPDCFSINVRQHSSDNVDVAPHFGGTNAASATAHIKRIARPEAFWGKSISSNLTDTGAAVFGSPTLGAVLLGEKDGRGALQAVAGSAATDLDLNPQGGSVLTPSLARRVTSTSSNVTPTRANSVVVINSTAGNRSVFMDAITFTPLVGYEIVVVKAVAANSVIFVPPVGTDTINGIAGSKTVTTEGEYVFRKIGTTAWNVTFKAFA